MQSLPIDLHLEVSSLRHFVNYHLEKGFPFSFNGKDLYEVLKRVVIDLETKPFLTFPKDESEQSYYDRYAYQSQEAFNKLIPDFFEYDGEFYDLERVQYVCKEFTRAEDFEKLFIVKLLELKSIEYPLGEFLYFQQYDSFYGQKESIDSFLYYLTEKDSNCHLLQELCQVLRDWIGSQSLELLKLTYIENNNSEDDDIVIEQVDSQEKWKNEIESLRGKRIKCKWTLEQIEHYFSFLYKEKSENGEAYLTKEQVEKIFENGFYIPENPIEPLFKLNCSKRYPVKNITFSINQFYTKSYKKFSDKRGYFQFFAMFIEGYSRFMDSPKEYINFSRNTSKRLPSRTNINWTQYLPADTETPKPSL